MTRRRWAVVGLVTGLAVGCVYIACFAFNALVPLPAQSYYATRTADAWATETARPTDTPVPGVGVPVRCGDVFEVTVVDSPAFQYSLDGEEAFGIWLILELQLVNLTDETHDTPTSRGYQVSATLNGRLVLFDSDSDASRDLQHDSGLAEFTDSTPPGVPVRTIVAFDVNPDAGDWTFLFHPGRTYRPDCSVEISLQ